MGIGSRPCRVSSVQVPHRRSALNSRCECVETLLVHDTAKPLQGGSDGHAGNMNPVRGTSALVGVARVVQTLIAMSATDAEQMCVEFDITERLYSRAKGIVLILVCWNIGTPHVCC